MESKDLVMICVVIIICVIMGSVAIALNLSEETQIKILSDPSLYNGENITIQLTTENGTPIANQAVNVTIIDANGGRNVQQLVTNEEGRASFTLNGVTVGNYTLECVFGENDGYKQSNCTSNLEIKEEVKKVTSSSSSNNGPYVLERRLMGDGSIFVYYSDGTYKSYNKDGSYYGWGYESPGDYVC